MRVRQMVLWYGGAGALGGRPHFKEVGEQHTLVVHQYARQIVERVKQGRKEEATALMKDFERTREQFFKTLDDLFLSSN